MKPVSEIQSVLDSNRFAVLATQHEGQPHASLMAFAPMGGVRYLIVATYRDTLKYRSLCKDGRVAILIDSRGISGSVSQRNLVVTAHGIASEVPADYHEAAEQALLARHSDLSAFIGSPDCAMLRVDVIAYEVVAGTEDVLWYKVADLAPA
jgi:nitroimidazol reductase NimA-like FMN-containing flavoprotein (pyridoxamine 5'-phosphate oxidase superfamily)